MIRKRKKGTIEKEFSYVMAVPKNQADIQSIDQIIKRLTDSLDFEVVEIKELENPVVFFLYKQEEYCAEIFLDCVEVSNMSKMNQIFTEEELEQLEASEYGVMVGLEFGESAIESYHMQIKLLNVLVPDILGIVDHSSYRVISGKWAMLAAKSEIPPSPEYIYSIHCISGEDKSVWLHTHGLNRCGVIDFEILNSDEDSYQMHADIVKTLSNIAISDGEMMDEGEAKYIMNLGDEAFVVTWIGWESVLRKEPHITNGGKEDRQDNHNENTGVIFTYLSEADYKKKKYNHVSVYNELLSEDPLLLFTTEETNRMRALALERFPVFEANYNQNKNEGIMKFGIIVDEEFQEEDQEDSKKEHIWFEVKEIIGDKIRAVLTQEPYYLKDYTKGEEYIMDKTQLTDWYIYTENDTINPDRIYLLQD